MIAALRGLGARLCLFGWAAAVALPALQSAEVVFDFAKTPPGETPAGFRSAVSGAGAPGVWKVLLDDVPTAFPSFTPNAPSVSKKPVLAQLSEDKTDEHFPLLIYEKETFRDFTITTRFKLVKGSVEQMAGLAFRLQDEKNYYYVRASALGNTFRFFKIVDGLRGAPIGPEIQIPAGIWHEMSVTCKGNQITVLLNGKEIIPTLTDTSFSSGKVAFWTKSDAVSYFADTKIVYTPLELPAKGLITRALQNYPRVLGISLFARRPGETATPMVIASTNPEMIGKPATDVEQHVIQNDSMFYGKEGQKVLVTLPLHDRNGDPVAAVRFEMKSFPGQTEGNAVARATPIARDMEKSLREAKDLFE